MTSSPTGCCGSTCRSSRPSCPPRSLRQAVQARVPELPADPARVAGPLRAAAPDRPPVGIDVGGSRRSTWPPTRTTSHSLLSSGPPTAASGVRDVAHP
ncbi:hypothetical protein QJS66_23270 [Kocuria rhizophila]|nr:hypothetical protein QJS66_23270 [Kocuria rhizophila]